MKAHPRSNDGISAFGCFGQQPWLGLSRLLCLGSLLVSPALWGDEPPDGELTTVFSTTHNGFTRTVNPDGSLRPISYVFGEGNFDSGVIVDHSLTAIKFPQLIGILQPALKRQGFMVSSNPPKAEQLIVVHWGRTVGWDDSRYGTNYAALKDAMTPKIDLVRGSSAWGSASSSSMMTNKSGQGRGGAMMAIDEHEVIKVMMLIRLQNEQRDTANLDNARLLGYYDDIKKMDGVPYGLNQYHRDLIGEVEDDRYYVVLIAYDFQEALKSKQRKVLWVTRFSLRARSREFDKDINGMVAAAEKFFAKSTHGLRHVDLQEAHVTPGEIKVIEYQTDKK